MISHIVMWSFKEEIKEDIKEKLKQDMKEHLEGLVGEVPGLLTATVQTNPLDSSTCDVALFTTLESEEALKGYSVHPKHLYVADTFVRPYVCNRSCVDYQE